MLWIYEDPEEEETEEAPTAAAVGQPQDTIDDGRPSASGPRYYNIFGLAPVPDVVNGGTDGGSAPAPADAEASDAERRTGERAVTNGIQGSEAAPRRSLRLVKSPQPERGVPAAPRPCKRRRCSDAVEDAQPYKRPRGSTNAAGINTPHNLRSSINGNTGGKAVKAIRDPIRRSARIAERERKQRANRVEELPPRSSRTRTTKKGHPR